MNAVSTGMQLEHLLCQQLVESSSDYELAIFKILPHSLYIDVHNFAQCEDEVYDSSWHNPSLHH